MKRIMKNISALLLVTLVLASCRKEELNPVTAGEPGVWGQGKLLSGQFTVGNDAGSTVNMQLKWIDVNRKLTMTKQEIFIEYTEKYTDKNGNPAVAKHGVKSLRVQDCKGNNEAVQFSISAADVYNLFQTNQFDYGQGKVAVFGNTRPAGARFNKNDTFIMSWAFTGSNGLIYKWWSVSVVNGEIYADQPDIAANTAVTWSPK